MSILNTDLFNRLFYKNKPKLEESVGSVVAANGENVSVKGSCVVGVCIDGVYYDQAMLIADIAEEGILGIDFLRSNEVIIDVAMGTLHIEKKSVNVRCAYEGRKCCRVYASEETHIPPESEIFLRGSIKRRGTPFEEGIVEPDHSFQRRGNVLLAKTLVNYEGRKEVPLRLLNPSSEGKVIRKGTKLGVLYPIRACTQEFESEDIDEKESCDELLEGLIKDTATHVEDGRKSQVKEFLLKNRNVFMKSDGILGRCDRYLHTIETGDALPIKQRPYRLPVFKKDEVDRQVEKMLEQNIISPSDSPWASPIVLVEKKDGTMRFCIDYRKLNSITKKDAYPLPRIDDSIDALAGSHYFSTLDLASGYWQLGLSQEAKEKTAFTTGSGLYHFNVLPFGLCNAPSSFERLMERVLIGLHWKICLVYLDDIIVYSGSFEEHVERLQKVFDCLKNAGLKLKPQKCSLFREEVLYLGFIVSSSGIKSDPEKLQKVREWPVPKNVSEVRSFLGLCSYYRKFVRGFSEIAVPLTSLTKKQVKFVWDESCQNAFEKLKTALQENVVLNYPDFSKPFILDCDASDFSSGAVLSQNIDGEEKVLAYFSKTHSAPERRYSVTRKELLSVIKSIKHFRHYLYGREFLLRNGSCIFEVVNIL